MLTFDFIAHSFCMPPFISRATLNPVFIWKISELLKLVQQLGQLYYFLSSLVVALLIRWNVFCIPIFLILSPTWTCSYVAFPRDVC
jgi:hypothetical protein